jgi:3,5-epimerase/4-reductase
MANRFLVWGGKGWVAGHLVELLKSQGKEVYSTTVRMQDREAVIAEIEKIKPTHILNAAGSTGRPNVDWCEDHKEETIRNNVIGTLNLADVAFQKGIHITVFATGCIYQYDEEHPIGGKGFLETDKANFAGSFYSETKAHVEEVMKYYTNCLILRLRMPVSDDWNGRNFVRKIAGYDNIVNIPNSNSILTELLPASILMAEHKDTGVYNFTNPGAISHNEVLELFKSNVYPEITWTNFSLDDQSKVIKAGRSNCELDTTKLVAKLKEYNYEINPIHKAYDECFKRMAKDEAAKALIQRHMAAKKAGKGAGWKAEEEN